MPVFSIVIPMYNRNRVIGRAITSCLCQDFKDFEIIVVDDGSTDDSVSVVEQFCDLRIRLIRSEENRGVCPTRNRGVASSFGEWIVFLDSDDELLPGALEIMHRNMEHISDEIGRMAFMYRMEDGSLSPRPALVEEVWDYQAYLKWLDTIRNRSDFLNCIRKSTFDQVKLPDDRSFERIYHLEFARHFKTQTFTDVVGIIHADAQNRSAPFSLDSLIKNARANVLSEDRIIAEHGGSMEKFCPVTFRKSLRLTAIHSFLLKKHARGWQYAFRLLQRYPFWPGGWLLIPLGLLDTRTLSKVFQFMNSRRIHKAA